MSIHNSTKQIISKERKGKKRMGSELVEKLPTIDFGKLEMKPGTEEWNTVRDEVYKACVEYGSFEAVLDATLIPKERLFEKLKEVFSMPLKTLIPIDPKTVNGYFWNPSMPLYERVSIRHGLNPGIIESISKSLWPNGEQEFCDLVHSYANGVSQFCEMVRNMIFDKLGLENLWDDHKNSTFAGLSIFKYRLPNGDEANVGVPAHKDTQLTTILSQHETGVSGLQIMKKNGQWLDCEFSSPHSYFFLINDCLTALSNGRLYTPYHQVIMGDRERYSIAAFTGFKGIIEVPEKLVDEDHPLRYKPFDALKYFQFCRENLATAASGNALEKYCGV